MGQCVSVTNGPWNAPATWSCQNPVGARVPGCNDVSITVAAGDTVAITAKQDYTANPYNCTGSMAIYVEGALDFSNGRKLYLPTGSFIVGSENGSIIAPPNGGGNSSVIDIGGIGVWTADDGNVPGPFDFPEPDGPLPVHLLSFNGNIKVDGVHFNWVVASEVNNDYFAIERSPDMVTWSVVHEQSGHGTSNQIRTYQGHDARPERRLMYYRLTQTDFDGSRESFAPIAINYGDDYTYDQRPLLFPNPLDLSAQQDLFVANVNEDIVQITILDLNGNAIQEIYQSEISNNPGRIEIDHEALSAGMYLVRIEGISWVNSEKLFVY